MRSRRLSLLAPRSIGLLLAGLAGSYAASRLRPAPPELGEARSEPASVPALAIALSILVCCALASAALLGWYAVRKGMETRAVAIALTGGDPDKAPALIARYGCGGCHTIGSVPGANGKVAAPLTGYRERVYVAGVLRNTPEALVRWIVDPPAFSPRTAMPVTGISEREARDVAALLYMQ